MPDKNFRKQIYRQARLDAGLNQRQWGRLFALGNLKNTAQVVGHKECDQAPGPGSSSKGVNMAEALAAQLLAYLASQGIDIQSIEFDEMGRITHMPDTKKPNKEIQ